MSVNPDKFKRIKTKRELIAENIEASFNLASLESLKYYMKIERNQKLQKNIHGKKGWRQYTR